MQPIIYDVAVSLDGYISGRDGDISAFAHDGPVVDDYMRRLSTYKTAIMGRETYEFGYRFGLKEGENPYPGMDAKVVSRTLELPAGSNVEIVKSVSAEYLIALKKDSTGPIYLVGGGKFAGHILNLKMVDILTVKRAPILLGGGARLFDSVQDTPTCSLENETRYASGYILQTYRMEYPEK